MSDPAGADTTDGERARAEDWDALGIGVVVVDPNLRVVRSNPCARSLLATPEESLDGQRLDSIVDPVDAEPLRRCVAAATHAEQTIRLPAPDGERDLLLRFVQHRDQEVLISVEDVSATGRSDPLLAAMRSILDSHRGFVGIADDRANATYVNARACELLGVSQDEVASLRLTDILHSETFNRYYEAIRPTLLERGRWSGLVRLAADDGPEGVWATVHAGVGTDGETIEWLAAVTDAGESATETAELAHRANHDHLTGLANRALFLDRLRLALLRRDRAHHPVSVAFLDLNGFKAVNDSAGHRIGDELLRLVAERLSNLMRPTDTVARWGGDEFVVLCENGGDAHLLAKRLTTGIGRAPFDVKGTEYVLGATVGTAESPPGPSNAEELVAEADAAMYRTKRTGGHTDSDGA